MSAAERITITYRLHKFTKYFTFKSSFTVYGLNQEKHFMLKKCHIYFSFQCGRS